MSETSTTRQTTVTAQVRLAVEDAERRGKEAAIEELIAFAEVAKENPEAVLFQLEKAVGHQQVMIAKLTSDVNVLEMSASQHKENANRERERNLELCDRIIVLEEDLRIANKDRARLETQKGVLIKAAQRLEAERDAFDDEARELSKEVADLEKMLDGRR